MERFFFILCIFHKRIAFFFSITFCIKPRSRKASHVKDMESHNCSFSSIRNVYRVDLFLQSDIHLLSFLRKLTIRMQHLNKEKASIDISVIFLFD